MSNMKDSGVEWIGKIPKSWKVLPIKSGFLYQKIVAGDSHEKYPRLSLAKAGVLERPKYDGNGQSPANYSTYQIVPEGELVFNLMGLEQDSDYRRVGIPPKDGLLSSGYVRLDHNPDVVFNRFALYYFLDLEARRIFNSYGTGIRSTLNGSQLVKIPMVFPPISEQQRIAKFLDEKTALIDEIISDSKKSIEELKAYKQSLITEIVTKGLDPNVTLVPSGIDWIGDIPEGWEVVRSKNILSYSKGLSITKENLTETGIPVINYGQIHSKYPVYFNPKINQLPFVSNVYLESKKNALLNQGDFVFADTSEDISGSGNFSSLTSDGIVFAGYHTIIARIVDKTRINFRYLAYYFSSELHRKQVGSRVSGVKVFSISQKILKSMLILLPNRDEQNSIANYLDQKTAQIDTIIAEKENLIFEYESYKKSMIYEYVTGKKRVDMDEEDLN